MSAFQKFLDLMKLRDDDEDEDDFEEDEDLSSPAKQDEDDEGDAPRERLHVTKKTSAAARTRKNTKQPMEVCVFKPTSFDDAKDIGNTILAHQTVLLNMEGVDIGLAQRIIDFTSGACYSLNGNLQKISNFIFIVTPNEIPISGDLQDIMDSFDLSGIQTGF